MALTSRDIKNKSFSSAFRGYNTNEVEHFRSVVCVEYDNVLKMNRELVEKNELLTTQLSRYKEIEEMLNKTLIIAQETADNVRENAKNEAKHIVKEANINSDRIVSNAIERAQIITSELDAVKSQTKICRAKLKIAIEEQLAIITSDED